MNPEYNITERIDRYLQGNMSPEEEVSFQNDLQTDKSLLEEFEAQKLSYEIVLQDSFLNLRNQINNDFEGFKEVHLQKKTNLFRNWLLIGSGIIVFISGLVFFLRNNENTVVGLVKEPKTAEKISTTSNIEVPVEKETDEAIEKASVKEFDSKVNDLDVSKNENIILPEIVQKDELNVESQSIRNNEILLPKTNQDVLINKSKIVDVKNEEKVIVDPCVKPLVTFETKVVHSFADVSSGKLKIRTSSNDKNRTPIKVNIEGVTNGYVKDLEFNNLDVGKYTIEAKDALGCTLKTTVVDINQLPCNDTYSKTFAVNLDKEWIMPTVDLDNTQFKFEIYSKTGQVLFSTNGMMGDEVIFDGYNVDGTLFPLGNYTTKLALDNGQECWNDITIFE